MDYIVQRTDTDGAANAHPLNPDDWKWQVASIHNEAREAAAPRTPGIPADPGSRAQQYNPVLPIVGSLGVESLAR